MAGLLGLCFVLTALFNMLEEPGEGRILFSSKTSLVNISIGSHAGLDELEVCAGEIAVVLLGLGLILASLKRVHHRHRRYSFD